jgi:hypothetical protein
MFWKTKNNEKGKNKIKIHSHKRYDCQSVLIFNDDIYFGNTWLDHKNGDLYIKLVS